MDAIHHRKPSEIKKNKKEEKYRIGDVTTNHRRLAIGSPVTPANSETSAITWARKEDRGTTYSNPFLFTTIIPAASVPTVSATPRINPRSPSLFFFFLRHFTPFHRPRFLRTDSHTNTHTNTYTYMYAYTHKPHKHTNIHTDTRFPPYHLFLSLVLPRPFRSFPPPSSRCHPIASRHPTPANPLLARPSSVWLRARAFLLPRRVLAPFGKRIGGRET